MAPCQDSSTLVRCSIDRAQILNVSCSSGVVSTEILAQLADIMTLHREVNAGLAPDVFAEVSEQAQPSL